MKIIPANYIFRKSDYNFHKRRDFQEQILYNTKQKINL